MKKYVCASWVVLALSPLASPAMAGLGVLDRPEQAWECYAVSPAAWGRGHSASRNISVNIALNECSVRTPWGQACYIERCSNSRSVGEATLNSNGGEGKPEYMPAGESLDFSKADPQESLGGSLDATR
ncbi:hypothetical protein CLV83_0438 [Marinobacterium mangrovicola]|uniref:DUF4189 domain-containing protein n=1 Tax=Marinobacterium mangrovicola TaxID=1476959 RepID=A0A4R1GQJ5_9GAMM|nr:hypothetical protein CLV83_0438 [Marinobacterium mangrovicola]